MGKNQKSPADKEKSALLFGISVTRKKYHIAIGIMVLIMIFSLIFSVVSTKMSPDKIIEKAKKDYIYHSGAIDELHHNISLLEKRVKIHKLERQIVHQKAQIARKIKPELSKKNEEKKTK